MKFTNKDTKETLRKMDISSNLLGYPMIVSSMEYFKNKNIYKISMSKELYPYLANQFDVTPLL